MFNLGLTRCVRFLFNTIEFWSSIGIFTVYCVDFLCHFKRISGEISFKKGEILYSIYAQ